MRWRPTSPRTTSPSSSSTSPTGPTSTPPRSQSATSRPGSALPTPMDRDEYIDSVAEEVDTMLYFVYGMLGVAVIIALMGIANTLSLSVHERRRELGLARAVGQDRSQVRSTVRWESVIIAVFGTIGGIGLGGVPRVGDRPGARGPGRFRRVRPADRPAGRHARPRRRGRCGRCAAAGPASRQDRHPRRHRLRLARMNPR